MKFIGFWNRVIALAGSILCIASTSVLSAESHHLGVKLTDEQSRLLNGYHQPALANFDMNSLSTRSVSAVPLISLTFTAETNLMKGNAFELGANYSSWTLNSNSAQIDVVSVGTSFTLHAPIQQAMDFSKSIREKVELCPEKLLDKLVVDGAVAINYSW
ncbi:hypothetical protein [Ketobacter alkanivorans]|uniref:Lipid/polyisoprenoid-binding YceI-like domain-containing protein n=1 Tax=Ketobacter alkanivorans TaxID=1917421 RepID=A0A2K9LFV2_9GAMM|nr:hypothetical protein [Ketobacter alkanivorans]AUM11152.1 hypothetical protein Kalk_01305 [Ketobacter alkanivorans]